MSLNKKPKYLYHASQNPNIYILKPCAKSVRDPNEGPVVFATPSLPYVTMFLVNSDDSWTTKGRFNKTFYTVISDKNRFLKTDKGGTIYTLPNDAFYCDLKRGMGKLEWVSKKPVKPIGKKHYESGLEAMIDNGVQVYFVGKQTFQKIRQAEDHGFSILQTIQSENQKLNKNVFLFGG
jgi:hypothetical protein